MKKILLTIIIAAVGMSVSAQSKGDITPTDLKMEKIGNTLKVSFNVNIPKHFVKSSYKATLTPVIYNGSDQKAMTQIVVQGKRMDIIEAREGISRGYKSIDQEIFKTKGGENLMYTVSVPYQPWMNGSTLRLDKRVTGCCNDKVLPSKLLASNIMLEEPRQERQFQARVVMVPKATEVRKEWKFRGKKELVVDFKQNSSIIEYRLFDNQSSIDEILDVVQKIKNDEKLQLNNIEIVGFASPEGTVAANNRLASARASALKDYVQKSISGLYDERFTIHNRGVNWDGLRALVAKSNMKYRDEVLYIIDNTPTSSAGNSTERLAQLKKLHGGAPYQYMYKNLFPQLRNACYIHVYYDVIMDHAADILNENIGYIGKGEYSKALPALLSVKEDPRAWNPIGVCYMMMGDATNARLYLTKAANNGNEDAKVNLAELAKGSK